MSAPSSASGRQTRLAAVDALRGSALLGLFLLHCVEHFKFSAYPAQRPAWLLQLDHGARTLAFSLFGGKAYAIFALMFGLSFFLILDHAAQRGLDFRGRFAWRLCVLGVIGYLFGVFYCGEILTMLALLGLPLALLYRVPTRWLVGLSALFLLQVPFLWQLGHALLESDYAPTHFDIGGYNQKLGTVYAQDGFLAVLQVNLWTGVQSRWAWALENGRHLQMFGLFLWGLLLGRHRVFEDRERSVHLARRALAIGTVAMAAVFAARHACAGTLPAPTGRILQRLFASYGNLAQMTVWAAGFVLIYHHTPLRRALDRLAPYGRTSLTNYITQSLVGMILFYHFGFGLFQHLGEFYSLLYGIGFFALQCAVSHMWLRRFHYGPFEWLWRCVTFLSFQTPLRKTRPAAELAAA